jgi:S-disulfanyl-L-cysteine oxidoreductase SoxD
MPMRSALIAAALAALLASAAWAASVPSPDLGQTPSAQQLADIDISIPPDGHGLPPGSGSATQGAAIFAAKCQVCHGPSGVGGPNDRLTGGVGSLATPKPVKTVASYWPYATTVFDYIRRAMPLTAPQSLTNDEAYALTAYLLSVDGVVPKDAVLDAKSLPQVKMPNREGFVSWAAREQPPGAR